MRVHRDFDRGYLNRVWISDMTYVKTPEGFLYLCVIRDACSRRVIGWAMDSQQRSELVEKALRMAHTLRGQLPDDVIFHADHRCQYTSSALHDVTTELAIHQSVGRTGVLG